MEVHPHNNLNIIHLKHLSFAWRCTEWHVELVRYQHVTGWVLLGLLCVGLWAGRLWHGKRPMFPVAAAVVSLPSVLYAHSQRVLCESGACALKGRGRMAARGQWDAAQRSGRVGGMAAERKHLAGGLQGFLSVIWEMLSLKGQLTWKHDSSRCLHFDTS